MNTPLDAGRQHISVYASGPAQESEAENSSLKRSSFQVAKHVHASTIGLRGSTVDPTHTGLTLLAAGIHNAPSMTEQGTCGSPDAKQIRQFLLGSGLNENFRVIY